MSFSNARYACAQEGIGRFLELASKRIRSICARPKVNRGKTLGGGAKVETFLGMVVEQSDKSIKIHLDNYDLTRSKTSYPNMLNTSRRLCAPRRCQSLLVSHSRLKMLLSSPICLSRSTSTLGSTSPTKSSRMTGQGSNGVPAGRYPDQGTTST